MVPASAPSECSKRHRHVVVLTFTQAGSPSATIESRFRVIWLLAVDENNLNVILLLLEQKTQFYKLETIERHQWEQ